MRILGHDNTVDESKSYPHFPTERKELHSIAKQTLLTIIKMSYPLYPRRNVDCVEKLCTANYWRLPSSRPDFPCCETPVGEPGTAGLFHRPQSLRKIDSVISAEQRLTEKRFYAIVMSRWNRSFFYAQKQGPEGGPYEIINWRWKFCALELPWHAQSANSVTTIRLRKRRIILRDLRPESIADSVKSTRITKKPSSRTG